MGSGRRGRLLLKEGGSIKLASSEVCRALKRVGHAQCPVFSSMYFGDMTPCHWSPDLQLILKRCECSASDQDFSKSVSGFRAQSHEGSALGREPWLSDWGECRECYGWRGKHSSALPSLGTGALLGMPLSALETSVLFQCLSMIVSQLLLMRMSVKL